MKTTLVIAKDAPLGVQVWPTTSPEYARNFTLASVTRQLAPSGLEFVIWTYQNGTTRMFMANEEVACEFGE